MKTLIIAALSVAVASCGYIDPVTITYTDVERGITVTERVGDGKLSPTIGLTSINVGDDIVVNKLDDGSIDIVKDSGK